jgi:MFS family permease
MPRFRFTIREALAWTAWLALYLSVRRAVFVRNSFFSIEQCWIEAHIGVVWTAVAIDRFFRPNVGGRKRYVRGMVVGLGAATILAVESIVSTGRMYHLFDGFASTWNSIPMFTARILGGLASGAVFGLGAVLFYSFLAKRRDRPRPPAIPPRTPPPCPTTGAHHDRAPP